MSSRNRQVPEGIPHFPPGPPWEERQAPRQEGPKPRHPCTPPSFRAADFSCGRMPGPSWGGARSPHPAPVKAQTLFEGSARANLFRPRR